MYVCLLCCFSSIPMTFLFNFFEVFPLISGVFAEDKHYTFLYRDGDQIVVME